MSWFKGLLHYQSKITHQACYSIRIRHLETWLPGPKWYLISKSLNYSFQLFTKSAKCLFKENKTKPSSGLIIKQFSALRILLATLCGGNWLLSSTTPAPVVQIKWLYFSKTYPIDIHCKWQCLKMKSLSSSTQQPHCFLISYKHTVLVMLSLGTFVLPCFC